MLPSLTIEGKHNRKFIFYTFAAFINFTSNKKTHVQFRLTNNRDYFAKRQTLFKTAEYRGVFTTRVNFSMGVRVVCVCVWCVYVCACVPCGINYMIHCNCGTYCTATVRLCYVGDWRLATMTAQSIYKQS